MLHDIKSYTQILKKNIFSWTSKNPVDPVRIWPEPDRNRIWKKLPDQPEPYFRSHTVYYTLILSMFARKYTATVLARDSRRFRT